MLRLPEFTLTRPESLDAALALLEEHGDAALPIAGGTDLVPNMKHGLFLSSASWAAVFVAPVDGDGVASGFAFGVGCCGPTLYASWAARSWCFAQ